MNVVVFDNTNDKDILTFSYNEKTNDIRIIMRNMDENSERLAKRNIDAHGEDEILISLTEDAIRRLFSMLRNY